MIADTSIWIDHFRGDSGEDLELFRKSLGEGRVAMAPVVLAELLSSTQIPASVEKALSEMEFAGASDNFWVEAGRLRRRLAKQGFNASLADCLVAQSCLEHDLPLLTRDQGIRKFGPKIGLTLI
jgi:predicted nucleic acid-binding protein